MGRYDGILIVSDFDHTMTDETGAVPERNREAIRAFMAEGGYFTVATGRSAPMFRKKKALFESNAPVIVFNGGACYDFETERTVFGYPLPRLDAVIAEAMRRYPLKNCEVQGTEFHCGFKLDRNRAAMFEELGVPMSEKPYSEVDEPMYLLFFGDEFIRPDDTVSDFLSTTPEVDAMFTDCVEWIEKQGPFSAIRSTPRNTEVMLKGVSKGTAARRLCNSLCCRTLVCAGDAMNDLAMLKEADLCFTPEDGDLSIRPLVGDRLRTVGPCWKGSIADVIALL